MRNLDNYREYHEKINMFLDKELNTDDEQDFIQKMHQDPQVGRMYVNEKNFRNLIKNNIHRPNVSPTLIQSIKDKIRIH